MFKNLLYYLFLFTTQFIYAQTSSLSDTLHINVIGQQQGLLQLNVKALGLDDLGYLWLGTEDGLNRFNGYTFKSYLHNPNDSTSIKDDHIRGVLFTKDTLWLATNTSGISGFILSKNKFFRLFEDPQNKELNTSYKILKLGKSQLLFSVKNNFIIFNRSSKESILIHLPKSPKENYITDVLQIHKNKYWLATTSTGVIEFNNKTLQLTPVNTLQNRNIQCFYRIKNNILIGTKKGLLIYNSQTEKIQKTSLISSVKCFYPKNKATLYLGTDKGIYLIQATFLSHL